MKKHYRGKRHTYARRTVRIGRDKKFARKRTRMIKALEVTRKVLDSAYIPTKGRIYLPDGTWENRIVVE